MDNDERVEKKRPKTSQVKDLNLNVWALNISFDCQVKKDILLGKFLDAARFELLSSRLLSDEVFTFIGQGGRHGLAVEVEIEPVSNLDLKEYPYQVGALFLGNVDDKPTRQDQRDNRQKLNNGVLFWRHCSSRRHFTCTSR